MKHPEQERTTISEVQLSAQIYALGYTEHGILSQDDATPLLYIINLLKFDRVVVKEIS